MQIAAFWGIAHCSSSAAFTTRGAKYARRGCIMQGGWWKSLPRRRRIILSIIGAQAEATATRNAVLVSLWLLQVPWHAPRDISELWTPIQCGELQPRWYKEANRSNIIWGAVSLESQLFLLERGVGESNNDEISKQHHNWGGCYWGQCG